ncbi:MAG: formylmethanofuran dehydrogenase subunit B [Gammaproteobacteria bacterium]
MSSSSQSKIFEEVTCPFCSLLCDDLVLRNRDGKLTVKRNGCAKAVRGFETADSDVPPHIHGKQTSLDEAVTHAAEILRDARQPIITGLGTDVSGSRAAMLLAESSGAILDHSHADGAINNALALQSGGWVMTTLAELKNRADVIVFIGTDGNSNFPRLFERFIWNQYSCSGLKKNNREIIYLGHNLKTRPGLNPGAGKATVIHCTDESLGETVAVLRALVKGCEIKSDSITGRKLGALKRVSERIKQASYGVFIWAPGELLQPHAELTIQTICELLKELNQMSRCAGLALGGDNGGTSFVNVCTWQSGYPSRISYTEGYPEYDPYNFSEKAVLGKTEADALLWISSFDKGLQPPQTNIPAIMLTRPSKKIALDAEVYIPIATPGLDHVGNLFRTDNVVCLPLKKIRQTGRHSVSDILTRIHQSL